MIASVEFAGKLLSRLLVCCLSCAVAMAQEEWKQPFVLDEHTVALYHFDEGAGNETRDATGDPQLTLRAKEAAWGSRPGFGSTVRFMRRADDLDVFVGPVNNDKLHLRTCTKEWTIEAWVRYTGAGGYENGHTYANICGTEDEGFGLPSGMRGGWNFSLFSRQRLGGLKEGLSLAARFKGSLRGRDPNHDTSSLLFPNSEAGGWVESVSQSFHDRQWHHVVWQFRYLDQTHFFFLDGRLIRKIQLPIPGSTRIVINDAEKVAVPFTVGGFLHSQDPPFYLKYGNFEGEIDELRISRILRYPIARKLALIRQKLPEAGLKVPYSAQLAADAAQGAVSWEVVEGELPPGLALDTTSGGLYGVPVETAADRQFVIGVKDETGATDKHPFTITVAPAQLLTQSLPPAFAGFPYQANLKAVHLNEPLRWEIVSGSLPAGVTLNSRTGELKGTSGAAGRAPIRVQVTDAKQLSARSELVFRVLPPELRDITPDADTVVLYDWQGTDGRLVRDRMGDEKLMLTWTNMGGDRRISWPGREGRFPQDTGRGEHGWVTSVKGNPKLDLKTCTQEWTVEAWVRRGGPWVAHGDPPRKPFQFGHVCGTYDTSQRGVWELYLSDSDSPDGSMAPGVHFLGAEEDQALMNLHPWKRPEGIVGDPREAGIRDSEWHHVAWQYDYAEDLHQLFLDGELIWQMKAPDGRKLVNNRQHDAQFSVFTRLKGYALYGGDFNFMGFGHFFGQIGEIRISKVRRYKGSDQFNSR